MLNGKRILVVEDDEVNLLIAEHILGKEGYEVTSVDNGESAVDIIKNQRFDLILMDIEMPIMDGLEATPLIRAEQNGAQVPIVALSAHTIPEKIAEFRQAGMDDYILKPFDGKKFQTIAAKFL
ncbi:MAG: response regulator [Bacteroidota bacterium]